MFTVTKHSKKSGNGTLPQAHTQVTPAEFVALDIETGNADEDAIKAACDRWTPPPNMVDEAKINAKREEAHARIREKSALLDAAPIVCVSVRTEKVGLIFSALDKKKYSIKGVEILSVGDERTMLVDLRTWLDASTFEKSVLVGFNILSFDIPKLRTAYVRNRLRLPKVLGPKFMEDRQPVIDLMRQFKHFSPECNNDFFVSFAEVSDRFGMTDYKSTISGADIPRLVAEKKFKDVLTYSAIEGLALWQVFGLMNSTAPELE